MKLIKSFAWLAVGLSVLLVATTAARAEDLMKPYTLAFTSSGDLKEKVDIVKGALQAKGFQVVGEYAPYDNAHIVIITSDEMKKEAARNELGGFGAIQRVSVTKVDDKIQVAYTNPVYMANAYRFKSDYSSVKQKIGSAIGMVEDFGCKGLTVKKLRKYHYTFGMEYFDDVYELAEYGSHDEALRAVEKKLASNTVGVGKIYRLDIPGVEQSIFGVSMKAPAPEDKHYDDAWQMNVVDHDRYSHAAYLPYEVMVDGNRVIALHMRFRMALAYPDLKMAGANSFMILMPSPKAIEKALVAAVGGKM